MIAFQQGEFMFVTKLVTNDSYCKLSYTVKNRMLQWLYVFDTHNVLTENVETHMTFYIYCKYINKDKINSDINFRLNPVSEKLCMGFKLKVSMAT